MSWDAKELAAMKLELEKVLKKDRQFGSLHHLEVNAENELLLTWDGAVLRPKSKANPGPYIAFMESIADCLSDFGYSLAADDMATESTHNNYFFIVPEDDADLED